MRRSFILCVALSCTVAILGCERSSSLISPMGAKPGEVKTLVDLTTGLEVTARRT